MALEIDPNHDVAFLRRGRALTLLKRWNEAIPGEQDISHSRFLELIRFIFRFSKSC